MVAGLMFTAGDDLGRHCDLVQVRTSGSEVVARVTRTRLLAVNVSDRPQVLLFRNLDGALLASTVLPVGGELAQRFPEGTLERLTLELGSRRGSRALGSGRLPLGPLSHQTFETVWFHAGAGRLNAWGLEHGTFTLLAPEGSSAGGTLNATAPVPPAHVPTVVPQDKSKGDLPPRLEQRHLPPI
jgi:hypothetical protein